MRREVRYRQNAIKKQKVQHKVSKKKKPKATRKPKAKLISTNPTISKTKTPIIHCTCPANYTSFTIDSNINCFKYGTKGPLSSAVSICAKDGARPPLPTNEKENADLLDFLLSKKERTDQEFALDLSDAQTEGYFMTSLGKTTSFTNWFAKPGNKTVDKNFFTMVIDGKWNVHDGNHTVDAIICQVSCSTSKELFEICYW